MLLNIAIAAWIIGSITLLVIKGDEISREYRDSLNVLHIYGTMHNFEGTLLDRLKRQLRLDFNNREVADDQVLRHFPSQVRRKIMRRLYHDHLINSKLMTGIRPQFVDAFLASCTVEIFSPGEEIVERGSIVSDLYLLVGGIAEVTNTPCSSNLFGDFDHGKHAELHPHISKLDAGNFIGEIGFFTESPVLHTVISVTVCKTLTLSRQSYQMLAQDHPGSAGKILHNLLEKVENESTQVDLPKPLHVLRSGSAYENDLSMDHPPCFKMGHDSLTAVKDLVKMHMRRRRDDDTTKLLFAASRGDQDTIFLMCGHGFNPNNTDYDRRTALMVASMKGNADAVKLLLKYNARPNEIDMNGSTALFEAAKSGNDEVEELLLNAGAELCMQDSQAASVLCQAVFDGNIMLLKRLVKAGINVNAADYDKRTAAHIAAAEGNVAAIRILAEGGADLTLPDRWGNTVGIEARRTNSEQILELLDGRSVDTDSDIESNMIL
jgi:ankyrin repeat protein/CRP-like cAMP-binding protein